MAKNLNKKEIGKGLSQRKDGRYSARFTTKSGKRLEKYFDTLPEARNWLEDARYEDKHSMSFFPKEMTVDAWFDFWIKNIICGLAQNTIRNYWERYKMNIQPIIGKMLIGDVKQFHCQKILTAMEAEYAGSTIGNTYITMGSMFKAAKDNDLIKKHPMDGIKLTKPIKEKSKIKFLTIEEQRLFLNEAKKTHNYRQYEFLLETGLRASEMIGLTWDNIDWEARTITINKSLDYHYEMHKWHAGPPKSKTSYRTIPLTQRAYDILVDVYSERETRTQAAGLSQSLKYVDRKTGRTEVLDFKNLVFLGWRHGMPIKVTAYDEEIRRICKRAGIQEISMHPLRHTYATRAIERGVNPKTLQELLGHASIRTTMDLYVHVTDESKWDAIKAFESGYENGVEMV